jgi:hypothetical protein
MAIREMKSVSLLDALDYLDLLAEVKPEKLERGALRWHGRLELEASLMTPGGVAAGARGTGASMCAGERDAW